MASTIKPLGDRVVAVQEVSQPKTASGIYLPNTAQEKPAIARIIAVGPDATLKIDDRIIYKSYATTEVKIDKAEYLIIREEDILATV